MSGKCVVGYALNAKKLRKSSKDATDPDSIAQPIIKPWRGGGLADILENNIDCADGVKFVQWDADVSAESQPIFDVIIHKLTEDVDRMHSSERIHAINCYLAAHPHTIIVDPFSAVHNVTSRLRTSSRLTDLQTRLGGDCPFSQPKYAVIDIGTEPKHVLDVMAQRNIEFPIICKPIEACGTPMSHNMVVIVSAADLGMLSLPCIIQQYYDHNEILFKVYVLGDDVMVFRRKSLPNLRVEKVEKLGELSLELASRRVVPASVSFSHDKSSLESNTKRRRLQESCMNSEAPIRMNEDHHSSEDKTDSTYNYSCSALEHCSCNCFSYLKTTSIRSVAFDSRKVYPTKKDFFASDSDTTGRLAQNDLETTEFAEFETQFTGSQYGVHICKYSIINSFFVSIARLAY
jgi:hypothetical protein